MSIFGIRSEFILFGLILAGIAVFNKYTLQIALSGLMAIIIYKVAFSSGFLWQEHFLGNHSILDQVIHKEHRNGEWSTLLNLFGLLTGFSILAKHFEDSRVPDLLPKFLPGDWKGPFVLLAMVFILSSFLDNIAAAMIGGSIALVVFQGRIHLGYLVAIVAASNAGGCGSVIGDTTTTMMWIDGIPAKLMLHAYAAAIPAFLILAIIASVQQDKYQRIQKDPVNNIIIDWKKLGVVFLILILTIVANVLFNFPALGVWIGIFIGCLFTGTSFKGLNNTLKGTLFLLALVISASLMPVEALPTGTWQTTFLLGFLSSVFDNIPLTKLALEQGGYDWGMLSYAVGFGGSIIWFGSSAGVAISNKFPQAKSVALWVYKGWHIGLAYVIGFFILLYTVG